MEIQKINLNEKLSLFDDYWNPRIAGELNGQHVKLAKFKGDFTWHKHENEDELFLVIHGKLKIEFRDQIVELNPNEFIIVPRGVEHRPFSEEEASILLFEPISTVNTGDSPGKLTRYNLENI